jgi:hypothetical protein
MDHQHDGDNTPMVFPSMQPTIRGPKSFQADFVMMVQLDSQHEVQKVKSFNRKYYFSGEEWIL